MNAKEWRRHREQMGWEAADARIADAIRNNTDAAGEAVCGCSPEMFEKWVAHILERREAVRAARFKSLEVEQ